MANRAPKCGIGARQRHRHRALRDFAAERTTGSTWSQKTFDRRSADLQDDVRLNKKKTTAIIVVANGKLRNWRMRQMQSADNGRDAQKTQIPINKQNNRRQALSISIQRNRLFGFKQLEKKTAPKFRPSCFIT